MSVLHPGEDLSGNVRVVEGLLSSQECEAVITAAVKRHDFSPPRQFDKDTRQCDRLHTIDPYMSDTMMRRLHAYLPEQVLVDNVRWKLSRFTHH